MPKYIKRDLISATKYMAEVKESVDPDNTFSYQLLRVLSPDDIDTKRWLAATSLDELPVSTEPNFTSEELLWAGKREGNLGGGKTLVGIMIGAVAIEIMALAQGSYSIFAIVVAVVSGFFLARYEWKAPIDLNSEKLAELTAQKQKLRDRQHSLKVSAKTQFENALEKFDTWKALSPKAFEWAISLRLEKEGCQVKTTRYSKDGGVDIEAIDKNGMPMIVQAKKCASNVGVDVVRVMIGVRESRSDKPKTTIYSLSEFTRGAKELSHKHGIVLRDIRSEFLRV
jgi:hypothetical protein